LRTRLRILLIAVAGLSLPASPAAAALQRDRAPRPSPPQRLAFVHESAALSTGTGSGAVQWVRLTTGASAGHTLVLAVAVRGYAATLTGIQDPRGNSWRIDALAQSHSANTALALASASLAAGLHRGDELELHFAAPPLDARLAVVGEFSGVMAPQPLDQSATASGGGTALRLAASSPRMQSQELAVSAVVADASGWQDNPGFTAFPSSPLRTQGAALDKTLFVQYQTLRSFEPVDMRGVLASSSSWLGALALYRASASIGDTVPPRAPTRAHVRLSAAGRATLTWTNPPDPDFDHVEIYRRPAGSQARFRRVFTSPSQIADLNPPFAAGDAAWNIALNTSAKRVAVRFVPDTTKTLARVYLHVKVSGSGYSGGLGGTCVATLHPMLGNGLPDLSHTLGRPQDFAVRENAAGTNLIHLDFDAPVQAGLPYVIVLQNGDPQPDRNYWSLNFLAADLGAQPSLAGAQGRNEPLAGARDVYYGLDPRESVGGSDDGGITWKLPGNTDAPEAKWLPTYALAFSDGTVQAQPFYSSHQPPDGTYTMVYQRVRAPWTIRQVAAYLYTWGASRARSASAVVQLLVDGKLRARVRLSGSGFVSSWLGRPVTVRPGQVVKLRVPVAAAGGDAGLPLRFSYADSRMAEIAGLGRSGDFYLDMRPYTYALPVFPLPYKGRPGDVARGSADVRAHAGDTFALVAFDSAGNRSAPVTVQAP